MSTILRFANEGWRGMFFSAGRRAACRVEHLERSGARRASASAAVAFGLLEAGSWSACYERLVKTRWLLPAPEGGPIE